MVQLVPDGAADIGNVRDVLTCHMFCQEGCQFRSILLDHLVGLVYELIIFFRRFIKPVDVFFAQYADSFQIILNLLQIALHKFVILFRSLLESFEDTILAGIVGS